MKKVQNSNHVPAEIFVGKKTYIIYNIDEILEKLYLHFWLELQISSMSWQGCMSILSINNNS